MFDAKRVCAAGVLACGIAPVHAGIDDADRVTPEWRGDAEAVHVGWDQLFIPGLPTLGSFGGAILDDTTPDVGDTSITGARFYQIGATFGHVSSSGNYYSGFGEGWGANNIITVPTDAAVNSGGVTTVVFQMLESDLATAPPQAGGPGGADASSFDRTDITLNGLAASESNFARGVNTNGRSQWFAQWEIAGDPISVDIAFQNDLAHTSLDAWEVDVTWSPDGGRLVTTPTIVPEPASLTLLGAAGLALLRRRRSDRA